MFFVVDSNNRHSVRKALTAAGRDSSAVRNMKNGELGKALYDAVAAGKLSESEAKAVCSATSGAAADVVITDDAVQAAAPMSAAVSNDTAAAVAALLASLQRPAIDSATVLQMVRDAMKTAQIRPAVIEIRIPDKAPKQVSGSKHAKFEDVLRIVNTRIQDRRMHCWLVGPSGSGKSYLASSVANASELPYYSTSAIQSKYDLIGFVPPNWDGSFETAHTLKTPFRMAFEHGGLFAWDDIDASDPRAFVAFNEALANGRFAFPDKQVDQHADFVCVASANTWGNGATADYVGRNKIDGATLSRFVRVEVDYDESLERDLVGETGRDWCEFVQSVRKAVRTEGLKVLVTPRHTLQGTALLAAGFKRKEVEAMTVFAGLDADTTRKIKAAA